MVLEILPDARQMLHDWDSEALQFGLIAYPILHTQEVHSSSLCKPTIALRALWFTALQRNKAQAV